MGHGHAADMRAAQAILDSALAKAREKYGPDVGRECVNYGRRYALMHKAFGLPGDETADTLTETIVALADRIWLQTGLVLAGYNTADEEGRPDGYHALLVANNMRNCLTTLQRAYASRDVPEAEYRAAFRYARQHIGQWKFFADRVVANEPRYFA